MTYSVIGSGNIGGALARQFSRAGVNVTIADRRGADTLAPLVQELGDAIVAGTIKDAVQVDIIFLVLPFAAVETFGRAKDQWRGKIVIDATNAYHVRPELLAGRLSSDIVAAALPGAAVVKAFNHLPAAVLAQDPSQNGGRRVVFISSNDDAAANEVKILAEQLGFSPILLGRIDEAGRLLQIDGGLILHNLVEWPFKERNRGANLGEHNIAAISPSPYSAARPRTVDLEFTWFNPMAAAPASANEIGRPKGRPKRAVRARGMLMEVPAAAEVAAAKAAHVPAAKAAAEAGEMTAAEAAHLAEVSAGEMTATELAGAEAPHVAEVSAAEMSPAPMEGEATVEAVVEAVVKAVMEAADSDEDRTIKPVAIVVIRIGVAVTVVVAGAIIRPIVVVAVRIAGGDAADHSGRDGIVAIAVNVAVSVSPNVVVMAHVVTRDIPKACVAMRDIPVQAV